VNRRTFLRTSSAAAALTVVHRPSWARAAGLRSQQPVTTFTELRRGVGVFTGSGGSIGYLVNADGAMAVDSQYMNTAALCVEGLKQRAPKGISLLINTHHHGDHTGGNAAFRASVQRIVQQDTCAVWHRKVAEQSNTVAAQAFADVTFAESWRESFGDERIDARYYGAGHTGGDAVITFQKANVVHLGDLYFNRAHPNIDRAAGARIGNWITVLERVTKAGSNDTMYIAGHAKENVVTTSRADVLHFRDYLSAVLTHAQRGVQAGHSKEQVQSLAALSGFEDFALLNARLSLSFVLGIAFDEAADKA
jgi:cyclase